MEQTFITNFQNEIYGTKLIKHSYKFVTQRS